MKKIIILLIVVLIISCEKENPIDKITSMPGWVVEQLNEDYYIQIPEYFTQNGTGSGFSKINPLMDIMFRHSNCSDQFGGIIFVCTGDSLSDPLPDKITGFYNYTSSSPTTLNNKEPLYDCDSLLRGIFYLSDEFFYEGGGFHGRQARYYMKIADNYISMLQLTYNTEKVDTVKMICNSIEKI